MPSLGIVKITEIFRCHLYISWCSPQHRGQVHPHRLQPGQVQLGAGVMGLGGHFKLTISEINLYK